MLKSIIKAVATPERLSGYAADGIQKGINGTKEETAATIAKYATTANEMAELAKNISAMLTDGRIDNEETAATVAKYATITNEMAELAKNISAMLTDGRIDNMERDTLQKMMEPLFAKVMELV